MKKVESLKIISMIVDGLDPYGENDPSNLPENNPITIRAICTAIMSLVSENAKARLRSEYVPMKPYEYSKVLEGPITNYLDNEESFKLRTALKNFNFNERLAARETGLNISEIKEKIHKFGIDVLSIAKRFLEVQKASYISIDQYLESIELKSILEAIKFTNSHKRAAYLLGITPRALRYKINRLNSKGKLYPQNIHYLRCLKYRPLDIFIKEIEKEIILNTLEHTDNNQIKAADLLGITYRSLRYRLEKLGIQIDADLS